MRLFIRAAAAAAAGFALTLTCLAAPAHALPIVFIDCEKTPDQCDDPALPVLVHNLVRPTIVGDPSYGSILTATPGVWDRTENIEVHYAWREEGVDGFSSQEPTVRVDQGVIGYARYVEVTVVWTDPETGARSAASAESDRVTLVGARTAITASAPAKVKAGKPFTITAHATSPVAIRAQIHLVRKGKVIGSVDANGRVVDVKMTNVRLPRGKHTLQVRYFIHPDDPTKLPSSTSVTIRVGKAKKRHHISR